MPHTRDGKLIQAGDTIYLPCKVESVTDSLEYCNVNVTSQFSMPPYEDSRLSLSAVNTRQFLSAEAVASEANPPDQADSV